MTIWPSGPPAWAPLVQEAFRSAGVTPLPDRRLEPRLDFPRSVAGLTDLATSAGLAPLAARELHWDWTITAEDFWRGVAGGVATVGQTLAAQPAQVRRAAAEAFGHVAAAHVGPDRLLAVPSRAVYVLATPNPAWGCRTPRAVPRSAVMARRPQPVGRCGGGCRARRWRRR